MGVVLINILPGIVIGVGLSLLLFIHRLDHPHTALLGRNADGSEYADLAEHPEFTAVPGLILFRFDAPLIFANADEFVDDLEDVVSAAEEPPTALVLDLESTYEIDTTGADALVQVNQTLAAEGSACSSCGREPRCGISSTASEPPRRSDPIAYTRP